MFSIKKSFNRSASSYNSVAVLQQEVANRLMQKLQLINAKSNNIIDLGSGTGISSEILAKNFTNSNIFAVDIAKDALKINQNANNKVKQVCANAYQMPFLDNSVDIIFSNLMMQWCWDLPKLFKELNRILQADGLLIFSTFGVDTLYELRNSWQQVDNYQHINEFADMHTIGDMLVGDGLLSPVMEMEHITLTYNKVADLVLDLKKLGANNNQNPNKGLTGKNKFRQMLTNYEKFRKDGKIPATYEVIYGHTWCKPQQTNTTALDVNNI